MTARFPSDSAPGTHPPFGQSVSDRPRAAGSFLRRRSASRLTAAAFCLALLLPAGSLMAKPADSTVSLLERSVHAADRVPFSGRQVTVMWQNGATEATITQEYHSGTGQVRLETVMPRRARGRIVVDDGRDRWQYEPSRRLVIRSPSLPQEPIVELALLTQNYGVTRSVRPERVADRWTDVITLTPRVGGKPARRLWLDRETGVLLRVEKFHADGSHLSASHFTDLQFGVKLPERLFEPPSAPGTRVVAVENTETPLTLAEIQQRFHVVVPAALPTGYRFAGGRLVKQQGVTVAHLRYQDGLNLVSLYLAAPGKLPRVSSGVETGYPRSGSTAAGDDRRSYAARHLNVLAWHPAKVDCLLVGDAAPEVLRQIADGTGLAGEKQRWALAPRARGVLIAGLCLLVLSGFLSWRRRAVFALSSRHPGGRRGPLPSPPR